MSASTGDDLFKPFNGMAKCFTTVSATCIGKTIPMTPDGFKLFMGEFA